MFKRNRQTTTPPPPSPESGADWSSDAWVSQIEELIEAREGEAALDHFLSQIGELARSDMHRRDKLNHLRFLGRLIEANTSSKHGPDKLARKVRMIGGSIEQLGLRPEGSFLDFGCGRHDPLALAAVAYANGFNRAIACDLEPVEVPAFSALSMYDILLELSRFPQRFLLPGGDKKEFRRRVKPLAPRPFAKPEFERGLESLSGKIDYRIAELTTLDVADGELGFVVSIATLEHVADPAKIYRWLFRKARPAGGQFHYIDLSDHRAYGSDSNFDAWSFLTEEAQPANHNRLRAEEHLALIRKSGFDIVEADRISSEIPAETSAKLLPRWRDLPREEIETVGLHLLLRRPA